MIETIFILILISFIAGLLVGVSLAAHISCVNRLTESKLL